MKLRTFGRLKRTGIRAGVLALVAGLAVPAGMGLADSLTGCDFAPNGATASCLGALAGSTFAGGDGNLLTSPTTYGTTDWQNVAGLNIGIDLSSGSADNSFGQGTKEDNPNVTVVTGSIPPNKSDLTRFYEASEQGTNTHQFLYLAWERSNVLGNANMDFEIDQKPTSGLTSSFTGSITLNRQAGDLLVTYDFTNGGGRPTVGINRWLVSATNPTVTGFTTNVCLSSSSFPCWGDNKVLDATDSIGAVNNLDPVTDPIDPSGNNYINPVPALQFGETAIDLTEAGVFQAGSCTALSSAFLKSRASASFTAEVKDFVAPIPVSITNCGRIVVKKVDANTSSLIGGAKFSVAPGQVVNNVEQTSSSLTEVASGVFCIDNMPDGQTYTVTETQAPPGYDLPNPASQTVTVTNTNTCTGVSASTTADLTFRDPPKRGAIQVVKTAKNHSAQGGSAPLSGATFQLFSGTTQVGTSQTTDANGNACFSNLPLGSYKVHESAAPTGYQAASDVTGVSVTGDGTCSSGAVSVPVVDVPLSDISVTFTSEAGTGVTAATITCGTSSSTNGSLSLTGLVPGTYSCTVVVDP